MLSSTAAVFRWRDILPPRPSATAPDPGARSASLQPSLLDRPWLTSRAEIVRLRGVPINRAAGEAASDDRTQSLTRRPTLAPGRGFAQACAVRGIGRAHGSIYARPIPKTQNSKNPPGKAGLHSPVARKSRNLAITSFPETANQCKPLCLPQVIYA